MLVSAGGAAAFGGANSWQCGFFTVEIKLRSTRRSAAR